MHFEHELQKGVMHFEFKFAVNVVKVRQSWLKLQTVMNLNTGNITRYVICIYLSLTMVYTQSFKSVTRASR